MKAYATPSSRDWKGKTGDHKSRGYGETLPDQIEKNLLSNHPSLKKDALSLPPSYDSCILGVEKGLLVYDRILVLEVLYQESLDSILSGVIETDKDYTSISHQAYIMALEMYEFNYDHNWGNGPLFK